LALRVEAQTFWAGGAGRGISVAIEEISRTFILIAAQVSTTGAKEVSIF
jgi:hypothetical protein